MPYVKGVFLLHEPDPAVKRSCNIKLALPYTHTVHLSLLTTVLAILFPLSSSSYSVYSSSSSWTPTLPFADGSSPEFGWRRRVTPNVFDMPASLNNTNQSCSFFLVYLLSFSSSVPPSLSHLLPFSFASTRVSLRSWQRWIINPKGQQDSSVVTLSMHFYTSLV